MADRKPDYYRHLPSGAVYNGDMIDHAHIGTVYEPLWLTTTPQPEVIPEPLLPCAVVLDTEGRLWVRADSYSGCPQPWYCTGTGEWHNWSDIDVAEVLYPGYEAKEGE